MSKKATFISKREIVMINEFLNCYINRDNNKNLKYKWPKKLTHDVLREFLLVKGVSNPVRGVFNQIKQDDYLTYKYLLVSDELGKVIPYLNPVYSVENIKKNIDREAKKIDLKEIREKLLAEMGYEYSGLFGDEVKQKDVINLEDYVEEKLIEEESFYYDDVILPKGKLPKRYSKNDKYRKLI